MGFRQIRRMGMAAALLLAARPAFAQHHLTSLTGTVATGYYGTSAMDPRAPRVSFVPLTLGLDAQGFVGHPDFLSYDVKPVATLGPQATEAGFLGGNGVSLSVWFLRKRDFPLRFFYENRRQENVFFGALTQISGYRSVNRNRSLGVGWEWHKTRWPRLLLDWQKNDYDTMPDTAAIPATKSANNSVVLSAQDQRGGWELGANVRKFNNSSEYAYGVPGDYDKILLVQEMLQAEGSAHKEFLSGIAIDLNGGDYRTRTAGGYSFDQDMKFLNGQATAKEWRRLRASARGSFSTNTLGRALMDGAGLLSKGGLSLLAPADVLPQTLRYNVGNATVGGELQYQATKALSGYVSGASTWVMAPPSTVGVRDMIYTTETAGARFEHKLTWAQLTADGHLTSGNTESPDQGSGRLRGSGYSASLQTGSLQSLEAAVSYHETRYRMEQSIASSYHAESRWSNASLGRTLPLWGLTLRAGGGVNRSTFHTHDTRYLNHGYQATAALQHRWTQANYSWFDNQGNTVLPVLAGLGANPATGALLPLLPVPYSFSAQRGTSLSASSTPLRRLLIRFYYTQMNQTLNGQSLNHFRLLDAAISYSFRRLTFEAGYSDWEQTVFGVPNFIRNRVYFKVTRPFSVIER